MRALNKQKKATGLSQDNLDFARTKVNIPAIPRSSWAMVTNDWCVHLTQVHKHGSQQGYSAVDLANILLLELRHAKPCLRGFRIC